jgi:hypothetical protein
MPGQGAANKNPLDSESAGGRLLTLGITPQREYSLNKPTVAIGSHPSNDVVLDDTTVSRRHATITRKEGRHELADLGSTNGTYVNGRQVRKPTLLTSGDEIKFGSVRMGFNPASVPRRMLRGLIFVAAMFFVGLTAARFRTDILPAVSSYIAQITSRQGGSSPSSANAQSASVGTVAAAGSASAAPSTLEPEWLKRVNYYRAMVKLAPIVEDPELSKGDREHTIYIVKNYHDRIENGGLGAEMHTEDPGSPGFTPEGLDAAKTSDMDVWSMRGAAGYADGAEPSPWGSPAWSIDGWMAIPFHRMPILNPQLASAGFGIYCEAEACAAGLNLLNGAQRKVVPGAAAAGPIAFPPDGATVAIRSFENEWPDPLTSCPGYEKPSGLAITVQLGNWMNTHLTDYSVGRVNHDGSRTVAEACGFDSTSYSNPDAYSQELGRNVLKSYGTVVVIPRAPLDKGAKYAVSMTANGKSYNWTFSTAP